MRTLYIHCGLAKTGTTSIQRYLSAHREGLREIGIDYPRIGVNSSGIAHHNIANEILGQKNFDRSSGTAEDIFNHLRSPDRLPTVVLSSEGFVNGLCKRRALSSFLQFVRSSKSLNDRTCFIFTVRPFSQYFDSWYIQRLKIGRAPLNMADYAKASRRWMRQFFRGLRTLKDVAGGEDVIIIDISEGSGDSVSAFLSRIGASEMAQKTRGKRHNERLGLKKASVIWQLQLLASANAVGSADAPRRKIIPFGAAPGVVPLRNAILKLDNFPDEVFRYRVLPHAEASRIQEVGRNRVPRYLKSSFATAVMPEKETYEAVSLTNIRISVKDMEILEQSLPADLLSNNLFIKWREKAEPASELQHENQPIAV